MSDSVVIGINFGVTNSSIGILGKNGHFSVIANADGDRMIPNAIGFSGEEEFCGSQAAHQVVRNPKNTIQAFRNYLGKSFDEITVPSGAALPDMVSKDGVPAYKIHFKEQEHIVTVPEAVTKQLKHVLEEAEAYLGNKVTGAVLAVPVYFTDKQRDELRKAATQAGINVLQIIQEPVAAALAYNFGQDVAKNNAQDKTALILDMGATSFDITILNSRGGIYTILETAHDVTIGGESFDLELVKFVAAEFKKKTKIDVSENKKAQLKIKTAVEITKKNLSRTTNAPCSSDEAIAIGCAAQASLIAGFEKEDIEASTKEAITVTPHTVKPIGVVGSKGEFITIIPDHTPLPAKRVFEFGNAEEGQSAVYFALYEGEQDPLPVKEEKPAKPANDDDSEEEEEEEIVVVKPTYHQTTQLAEVVLAGLPAGAKAGSLKIEATVQVDINNKVTITLREKTSGKQVRAESA
ncbi:Hsp70 protein that interacts with Zuo1p [Actinomortierella wolfii]|nr:Hsp70 protein that interacts with Zuo1p [Actinomortierella wolfii]